MAADWDNALTRLTRRGPIPPPWSTLSLDVYRSFWDVLAYEHDDMASQAATAREDCNRCVQRLRDAYDAHPELGPVAADEMTDRAIQQARAAFADDLQQEGWRDWRAQRGQPRGYF